MIQDINEKIKSIKENSGMSASDLLVSGERWLLENGIVSEVTHNNIIINLYMNFDKAKYVEYFMNLEEKSIEVHLYFGFWRWLFKSETSLTKQCEELLKQYLPNFEVIVKKERYAGKRTKEESEQNPSKE